ncbi:MAG: TRL-like family protein [Pseudomonadales bacterium]|nr:TRL-like family protein [Pseudomonadales bacterium]
MKKQIGKFSVVALTVALLSGCANNSPVVGGLYTGVTHSGVSTGGILDSSVKDVKKGVSSCISVLSLVAVGDCSEDTAKRNGGITNVHSVYHESTSVYIFFNKYETIVTGE